MELELLTGRLFVAVAVGESRISISGPLFSLALPFLFVDGLFPADLGNSFPTS